MKPKVRHTVTPFAAATLAFIVLPGLGCSATSAGDASIPDLLSPDGAKIQCNSRS